ncbi:MAG: hypothetical protein ABW046_00625 [Actinoplanes sp.]
MRKLRAAKIGVVVTAIAVGLAAGAVPAQAGPAAPASISITSGDIEVQAASWIRYGVRYSTFQLAANAFYFLSQNANVVLEVRYFQDGYQWGFDYRPIVTPGGPRTDL